MPCSPAVVVADHELHAVQPVANKPVEEIFPYGRAFTVRQLHGSTLHRPSHPMPKAMRMACDWTVPSILTFSYLASRISYGYSSSPLLANFSSLPSSDAARELTVATLKPTPQSSSVNR